MAGLAWRRDGAPRVLCLHGWLDNAASYIPLSSLLSELDLVALDLPGHGLSEHRHSTTRYHFMDYLFNVDAALDALGWQDCHVMGHSMGAAVGAAYSAGAPEKVRSLVSLDTIGPISVSADSTAARLRRSLLKNRRGVGKVRQFGSIDEMVNARQKVSDLSTPAARLICQRAARKTGDHYEWRSDPALNWVSSLVMTHEQALDLIRNIEAPTLTFIATPEAPWASKAKLEARKAAMVNGQHETLEGHHHFHMDAPEQVAGRIQQFILDNDRPHSRDSHEQAD